MASFHIYYANVTYFPSPPAELSVIIFVIAKKNGKIQIKTDAQLLSSTRENKLTEMLVLPDWACFPCTDFSLGSWRVITADLYWWPLSCSTEKAEKCLTQRHRHGMDCSLSELLWSSIKLSGWVRCWMCCCTRGLRFRSPNFPLFVLQFKCFTHVINAFWAIFNHIREDRPQSQFPSADNSCQEKGLNSTEGNTEFHLLLQFKSSEIKKKKF